jgi:hypothetical protein
MKRMDDGISQRKEIPFKLVMMITNPLSFVMNHPFDPFPASVFFFKKSPLMKGTFEAKVNDSGRVRCTSSVSKKCSWNVFFPAQHSFCAT